MFGKKLLVAIASVASLTLACGEANFTDRRKGGTESDESLELTSKKQAQQQDYNALLKQATSHFNLKGGSAPKKTVNADNVLAALNKKLPSSSPKAEKPAEPKKSASLNLAGTQTSQTITPEQICAGFGYVAGTPEYDACVANVTATIGTGIIDWTYDPEIPAVRVTQFPLTIPGYAPGMCVYARISLLAIGIACGNASGGAWAGCDIWNGCGSGYF